MRVAFALDSHDREVISWVATTAGISGEMIRDMMVHCVEQRFGDIRAPCKVQWLSDNGSIFAAYPGTVLDGRDYIAEAIARGAAAVLWEHSGFRWNERWEVANLGVVADLFEIVPALTKAVRAAKG